ncbi:MAG TPA: phosphate ABC transporter substrate-binding protein PstS [Rhizomicrobium sp.]|nr:phosphate ABC transporter substrate-binding protein PstS [Rhizomicrobium sp.]
MKASLKTVLAATFAASLFAGPAVAAEITGAGSTFVFPILSKWSADYTAGDRINYQSIGSGGGIKQIESRTVTFGASDKPLATSELNQYGMTQFPVIVGGESIVVHLPGIQPGQLVLDGPTLANIYLGQIKKWNDPAIKKLNPNLPLPNMAILVVHRSDGSGTTFIFANYLSKVSPEWAGKVGADTAVAWPAGIGGKGNEGVAGSVAQLSGSIGYVEYAYALQNHLTYTKLINRAGKTLDPSISTFRDAAASADWAGASSQAFNMVLVDQPGPNAWPITGATWVIMYKKPPSVGDSTKALNFFKWAYSNGDKSAEALQYVPLPENAVKAIEASWREIQGSGM